MGVIEIKEGLIIFRKYLGWIAVYLFIITDSVLVFGYFWHVLPENAKGFDFGSLFGGVIGGLLTLLGVRWTLQKDKEKEFLRSYAKNIILLENKKKEIVLNIERNPVIIYNMCRTNVDHFVLFQQRLGEICNEILENVGGNVSLDIFNIYERYSLVETRIRQVDNLLASGMSEQEAAKRLQKISDTQNMFLSQISARIEKHLHYLRTKFDSISDQDND